MKSTNQKPQKIGGLWIDECLLQHQENNKQNVRQFFQNVAKDQNLNEKRQTFIKDYTLEIPFAQRFKGKLFTFNKLGVMQKLDQLHPNSLKASLVFNKIKLNGNSCVKSIFRNRKNFVQINKTKISSRESIQTKNTHRQTKSLDASKVSSGSCNNKHRYVCNYSQIKEQQIEETIIKNPTQTRKIYTSLKSKNNMNKNVRKQLQYQTLTNNSQVIESPKQCVKRFFTNENTQKDQSQILRQTPNFISLDNSRNIAKTQKQIPSFPRLKMNPKQFRMSKRHQTKPCEQNHIGQMKGLPKINFSRHQKIQNLQKERLLTIR